MTDKMLRTRAFHQSSLFAKVPIYMFTVYKGLKLTRAIYIGPVKHNFGTYPSIHMLWVLIETVRLSTHNICFGREIRELRTLIWRPVYNIRKGKPHY